jgi:hypothetical protein
VGLPAAAGNPAPLLAAGDGQAADLAAHQPNPANPPAVGANAAAGAQQPPAGQDAPAGAAGAQQLPAGPQGPAAPASTEVQQLIQVVQQLMAANQQLLSRAVPEQPRTLPQASSQVSAASGAPSQAPSQASGESERPVLGGQILPSSAPASHLDAFPQAQQGAAPMQLADAAAAQQSVSGQPAHTPASIQVDSVTFAAGSSPTVAFNQYTGSHAGLAATTSGLLAHLPKGIRPLGPITRESAPKTAADFADSLWHWLQTAEGIRTPPALFDAWQGYVRLAAQYASDHGVSCARAYHGLCMEAAERGWWHPLTNGPSYTQAYTQHILPAKSAGRTWNRAAAPKADKPAAGGFKRKAPASGQEPPATRGRRPCHLHPHSSHTDAECLSQRDDRAAPRAQPATGDSSRQTQTPAGRRQ